MSNPATPTRRPRRRNAQPYRAKKITKGKATRLVDAIAALTECVDCPDDLQIALDDARRAISPWYDQ